jgi:MFS family permease
MVGALLTGAALAFGVDYRLLYPMEGAVMVVVMAAWLRGARQPIAHEPAEGLVGAPIWRDRLLLVLGLAAALAFVIEGAMEAWSAIYFRSALGMPALVGASGVALFHGAMTVGRLANVGIQRRIGRRDALRLGGLLAAVGMAAALATDVPLIVLVAFGVVGLAVSGAAPIALSLAGDSRPGESGRASSAVTVVGYSGFLVGPALIGGVAELAGLRVGLGLVALAGLGIAAIGQGLNMQKAPRAVGQPVRRPGAR